MDGAILVVSGDKSFSGSGYRVCSASAVRGYDGPMPQTREHILLSKQVGVLQPQILHICILMRTCLLPSVLGSSS